MDIYRVLDSILSNKNIHEDIKGQELGQGKTVTELSDGLEDLEGIKAGDTKYIVGNLLKELGIKDSPDTRGLTLFALLEDIPLKGDILSFFIGKRFKTAHFYKSIIKRAKIEGYTEEIKFLKESLPKPETFVQFLKDLDKNLEKIHLGTLGLCQRLLKDGEKTNIKRQLGDIYSGILLQIDKNSPFLMAQVPLLVEGDIYPSEIWTAKQKERAYIEISLPYLRTTGCLIEDWSQSLKLTIYTKAQFMDMIEEKTYGLKDGIEKLGFKCRDIRVVDGEKDSGLLDFIGRFYEDRKTLDIRV